MVDVYGHKEQRRCDESPRLIGGRSPGRRDSRRALDDEELFVVEGSQKIHWRNVQTAENVCQVQGANGKHVQISSENAQQLQHRLCALLSLRLPTIVGHSARCIETSKTSKEHATAVVNDECGHFMSGEEEVNRPQEPSAPLHGEEAVNSSISRPS